MDAIVADQFETTLADEDRPVHEIFKHYGFYAQSGPVQRKELLEAARPLDVPAGHVICDEGEACQSVVFLQHGMLRAYTKGESGRETSLYYVRRGECCPVIIASAKLETGAIAGVEASSAVHGLTIDAASFRTLEARNEALRDTVYEITAARLGSVIELIREITTRRVEHRLARYLAEKFTESLDSPPVVAVTQRQVALDLGTAREVVSRRLQELETAGAVRINRGRIVLLDRTVLEAQAGRNMTND